MNRQEIIAEIKRFADYGGIWGSCVYDTLTNGSDASENVLKRMERANLINCIDVKHWLEDNNF